MTPRNPSSKPPVRPAGDRSASTTSRRRDADRDELRAQQQRERAERASQSLRMGLLWIGGFVLVAGIGGFFWYQSSARAAQERADRIAHYTALRTELLAESSLTPAKAPALLQRIEATRAEWERGADAESINRQAEQARTIVATAAAQEAVAADLATLQKDLASEGKTAEAWQAMHDKATAVRARVPKTAPDLLKQLDQLIDRIAGGRFEALLASAATAEPSAAVKLLVAAEDLASDAFDANAKSREAQQPWTQRLTAVAPRLDAAMKAAFPEPAIAAVAAQDLKTAEADWAASTGGSLTRSLQDDTLTLQCEGGKNTHRGVVVLRKQAWHACVLSFDARLERGKAMLFARAHTQFGDKGTGGLVLSTSEAPGAVVVPAGKDVHVEVAVVGDQVVATVDQGAPQRIELHVTNAERRGSIAAVVHPDTSLVLRHLRIRKLI